MNENPIEVIVKILSSGDYTAAQQNDILKAVKTKLIDNLREQREKCLTEAEKISQNIDAFN